LAVVLDLALRILGTMDILRVLFAATLVVL
jgi:hypothetical protein